MVAAEPLITARQESNNLNIESIFYKSYHEEEEKGPASPQHKSVYVDEEGPDDEAGSGFGSSTANQTVNETVFYMPPSEDSTQEESLMNDYATHHTQSRLQARARASVHSNLPRWGWVILIYINKSKKYISVRQNGMLTRVL